MNGVVWIFAVLLILIGLAGTVLPGLPGIPVIYAGILLAAWQDDFQRVSVATVIVMAFLTLIAVATDYLASLIVAKKAGASNAGVVGAAIGTAAGIFSGLWGLLFLPLLGAVLGEWMARRNMLQAGKIGVAAFLGVVFATAFKLAFAFAMIGMFIGAWLI